MNRFRLGACALLIVGLCVPFATAAGASTGTFNQYTQPGTPASPSYTGTTCAIDLSSIPDGTTVNSVTGCGVTVTFSVTMEKLSVPSEWNNWGSPPNTESATPAVLYTTGESSVTLTYHTAKPAGAGRRTVGVEAEGNFFGTHTITATFTGAGGGTDGTITRDVTTPGAPIGSDGALLFAARTKTIPKVTSLTLSTDGDFAIAQIRV